MPIIFTACHGEGDAPIIDGSAGRVAMSWRQLWWLIKITLKLAI